ncbi:MAG: ATPase [Eubacterium sp.]|nr:ATPase [Eubacterium sp.]
MTREETIKAVRDGQVYLGIELGSTRIKTVVMTADFAIAAEGSHTWQSTYENGSWTYSMEEVEEGLRASFADAAANVKAAYGEELKTAAAMGISAMMHGYLAFDKAGNLLAPFRTWQNTTTGPAAEALSALFAFNIPQRWSIAHLYQAILNGEEHVGKIAHLTTLAGYVHEKLTGRKVLGIGDASGMFPIDSKTGTYDAVMADKFDDLVKDKGFGWKLRDILPEVLLAGEEAGSLTEEGAAWLDPSGTFKAGVPCCPPEGDAGTGMAATNATAVLTGNVSAGTSVFSMIVLEDMLKNYYPEIDMVTTPDGKPVAMVHCNNCTVELNDWAGLFGEFAAEAGGDADKAYEIIYKMAEKADADCGGIIVCNYSAGEPITGITTGFPLTVREPGSRFSLKNLSRAVLYAAVSTLKLGNDILMNEGVKFSRITGHGGFFKNGTFGAQVLAAALKTPVTLMKNAEVGGPYGCALLAAYRAVKKEDESLDDFLAGRVFADTETVRVDDDAEMAQGFDAYIRRFKKVLAAEKTLSDSAE